jgi:hypothetical protein
MIPVRDRAVQYQSRAAKEFLGSKGGMFLFVTKEAVIWLMDINPCCAISLRREAKLKIQYIPPGDHI